jgi:hypothetical protein
MNSFNSSPDPPFASDAVSARSGACHDDSYRTLDELMAVVEALCPEWPERAVFIDSGKMLL